MDSGTVSEDDATVVITDENGNVIETVEVTDGTFTFTNIPNGTYVITATTENSSVSAEVTVYNADITDIELALPSAEIATKIFGI